MAQSNKYHYFSSNSCRVRSSQIILYTKVRYFIKFIEEFTTFIFIEHSLFMGFSYLLILDSVRHSKATWVKWFFIDARAVWLALAIHLALLEFFEFITFRG